MANRGWTSPPSIWLALAVDKHAVRLAFDEQVRRHPTPELYGGHVERTDDVVRSISEPDGWNGVTWSALNANAADRIIAGEIDRFAELGCSWEWKHYSYDEPPDLADRLMAAGFVPEPSEALLVAEVADLALDAPPVPRVELRPVADEQDVGDLVWVHHAVFGDYPSGLGDEVRAGLARRPTAIEAVVAWADDTPIGAGRIDFHAGTEFASLWGGGTVPAWRRRGVFAALVAHRAALASKRGVRYLQVDALPASRPILERLGFVELATTTPYVHPPGPLG